MLLVAGGQLDPNIGALLRQCLARGIAFKDLLVGPELMPSLRIDLNGRLFLDGRELFPSSCFVRHDVFLAQRSNDPEHSRGALNWFHALRDWALAQPHVRLLNRQGRSADQGKYVALVKARACGLTVPETAMTNVLPAAKDGPCIRKPVAGGELTTLVEDGGAWKYPYFVQPRLERPELRVYRISDELLGFLLRSPDLDYRSHHRVEIEPVAVPEPLGSQFITLCVELGLDFAAADFMQDAEGKWLFLEVNSQPMFAAFDTLVGGRISQLLLDWLLTGQAGAEEALVA